MAGGQLKMAHELVAVKTSISTLIDRVGEPVSDREKQALAYIKAQGEQILEVCHLIIARAVINAFHRARKGSQKSPKSCMIRSRLVQGKRWMMPSRTSSHKTGRCTARPLCEKSNCWTVLYSSSSSRARRWSSVRPLIGRLQKFSTELVRRA